MIAHPVGAIVVLTFGAGAVILAIIACWPLRVPGSSSRPNVLCPGCRPEGEPGLSQSGAAIVSPLANGGGGLTSGLSSGRDAPPLPVSPDEAA